MQFLTSYFWRQGEKNALVLQQVRRKKGNFPIVFACICGEGAPADDMAEWFHQKALACARRGTPEEIARRAEESFHELMAGAGWGKRRSLDFVCLFCAEGECFYAWHGDMDIRVLNQQFGRRQARSLTMWREEYGCERVLLEENVGLLIGARGFFDALPESTVTACLAVIDLTGQQQADRHLAEACGEAARMGAESVAAILVATKEGRCKKDGRG